MSESRACRRVLFKRCKIVYVLTICQNDELSMCLIQYMIKEGSQDVIPDEVKEHQASDEVEKINTRIHTHTQLRTKGAGIPVEWR